MADQFLSFTCQSTGERVQVRCFRCPEPGVRNVQDTFGRNGFSGGQPDVFGFCGGRVAVFILQRDGKEDVPGGIGSIDDIRRIMQPRVFAGGIQRGTGVFRGDVDGG